MIENSNIPKHWNLMKLGEVCQIIMGQSPPSTTYNSNGIGLPFYQGKAEFTELHPIVEKWCNSPKKIAEPNDILLSVRAPVGTTNIANVKCCIGRGLAAIRYENYKYLFYFLRSIEKFLDEKGTGTTFRAISGQTIRTTEIPLPPLPEQRAIVAKIEELLSDLENGKQQLLKAQEQLKIYRQSLLKAAFEGKLTNKNLNEGELPKGWKWVKFGELFTGTPQNGLYKPSSQYGSGIPILRIDGFYDGTILSDYDYKRVQLTKEEIAKYLLSIDDIVVNRVNSMSHLGKCGLVKSLKESTVFESNVMKIQINKELASPHYLTYFLASSQGIKELTKNAKQAVNQASINQTDVSNANVPLPLLEEQARIVSEIESKLTVCDKIAETITESITQAETLRQSILKKAFEGKLVSQSSNSESVKLKPARA